MQIVIDIDDNLYTRLFDNGVDNYDDAVDMAKAIRKGTELKQGKWHKTGLIDKVACSNCKSQLWDITRDEVLIYKYCPNCGAKMEVENDS